MEKLKKTILQILFPLIVVGAIFAIWAIAAAAMDVSIILPSPTSAFREFFAYLASAEFYAALGGTLFRALIAFAISFVFAMGFAVLAFVFDVARRLIAPFLSIVRSVPTMAVIFILIIYFSPSVAPVAVAVIVIFPTLYSAFYGSLSSVDAKLVQMSRVYGVKQRDIVRKLYLPHLLPQAAETGAGGFSLTVKLVIAAEALALTRNSIGKMMQYAKIWLEMEKLFALTIAAILLGVLIEILLKSIVKLTARRRK